MVNYCCIAKCNNNNNNYKMHRFPRDEQLFQAWLCLTGNVTLKKKDPEVIRKNYRVCDIHFDSDCRVPGRAGADLRANSIPSLYLPECSSDPTMEALKSVESGTVKVSAATIGLKSPAKTKKELKVQVKDEVSEKHNFPSTSCNSPSTSTDECDSFTLPIESKFLVEDTSNHVLVSADSSNESVLASTSIHSEINKENHELYTQNGQSSIMEYSSQSDTDSNCSTSDVKNKWISTRYFDKCLPPYMCNSENAKKNWNFAKYTMNQQKRKIRSLQQNVRRLKTRNNTLKMLFKYLKDNDLVTEDGHSVISAFLKE